MPMDPVDYELSMKISQRGRTPDPPDLRSLLIHRLTGNPKAVLRRSRKPPRNLSMYCEKCEMWFPMRELPGEWTCIGCQSTFQVELVVYEEADW